MAVQTTKIITILAGDIIRDYICEAKGFTVSDYDAWSKYNRPKINWDIKTICHPDTGDYKQELTKLKITIEE